MHRQYQVFSLLIFCIFNYPSICGQSVPDTGDQNRDGRISIADVCQLISIVEGTSPLDPDAAQCQQTYSYLLGIRLTTDSQQDTWTDQTRLTFTPSASADYVIGEDMSKFWSEDESVPQICTGDANGQYYGLQSVDHETFVIPLGIRIAEMASHQIGMKETSATSPLYLIDKALHRCHCLTADGPYTFTSLEGTYLNRFVVATTAFVVADCNHDAQLSSLDIKALAKIIITTP